MKKLLFVLSFVIASIAFTGCGGGGGTSGGGVSGGGVSGGGGVVPPATNWEVLYIDDANLNPIAGLPYQCGPDVGYTDEFGGFSYVVGDDCTFDFTGFDGNVYFNDPLYLDYDDGSGVVGVSYDCDSGISGATDYEGGFAFDQDDMCTFYL